VEQCVQGTDGGAFKTTIRTEIIQAVLIPADSFPFPPAGTACLLRIWLPTISRWISLSTRMESDTASMPLGVVGGDVPGSLFVYLPLHEGEIRLLRLHPGRGDEAVNCELIQVPWLPKGELGSDGPVNPSQQTPALAGVIEEYEALSYTWDTESVATHNTIPIILNGYGFHVTTNLESALRHLRQEVSPRTFWIDAICIDQKNNAEKEQQVRVMHRIYDCAQHVVVWLGPESASSDLAITFAQEIYSCFDATEQWIHDEQQFYLLSPSERSERVKTLVVAERASAWVALHRLLSRRWWSRAWILQELLVAKEVIVCCGKLNIPWPIMSLAISVCRATYHSVLGLDITVEMPSGVYQYDWPSHFVESSFDIVARRGMRLEDDPRTSPDPQTLSIWLSGNRHRSCSFPHDKIYSILGLLNPAFQNAIHLSYSIDIIDLYKAVIKAYVEISGRLDLICHSQHSIWQPNKPSWMPDWGRHERAAVFSEIALFELHNSPLFDSARATFSVDLNVLTVRGTCIGEIQLIELEFSMLEKLKKEWWDCSDSCVIETAENRMDQFKVSEASNYWYFDAFARKLFEPALATLPLDHLEWDNDLNLMFEMIRLRLYPESSDWYERRATEDNAYEPDAEKTNTSFESFYVNLQGLLKSRTIFETMEQEIGVAPDFARPGDWVCMLFGCRVPVILRQRGDGSFMFVGDAYVYQAKDGDVLKELEAGRCQLRNFNLS
jgi:hypothetical protein